MPESPDVVAESVKALGAGPAAHEAYKDLLQPAAREIGQDLLTVAHVVHRAMAPLRGAVWCYDQINDWLSITLTQKLARSKPENIQSPDMTIAGPVLLYLPFCKDEETLKNLFANLLASSMDATTRAAAHPSFVYIIQQLSADEAKILSYLYRSNIDSKKYLVRERETISQRGHFVGMSPMSIHRWFGEMTKTAGCQVADYSSSYLDNLIRLQILEIDSSREMMTDENLHAEIPYDVKLTEIRDLLLTDFVIAFLKICVEGPAGAAGAKSDRSGIAV